MHFYFLLSLIKTTEEQVQKWRFIFSHPPGSFRHLKLPLVSSVVALSCLLFVPIPSFVQVLPDTTQVVKTPEPWGYLNILSQKAGLKVCIDKKFVGFTPVMNLKIPAGQHQVAVLNPQRSIWMFQDWVKDIYLAPGDTVTLKPVFERYFIIRSDPFDAQVIFEGKVLGKTPLIFSLPQDKSGVIILRKNGYHDYLIPIDTTGKTSFMAILKLKDEFRKELMQAARRKEVQYRKQKILAYSFMGLGLCSGIAAVYFKHQADEAYQKYLRAGNVTDMNHHYQKAQKWDTFSGISFGVFEGSFVLSVYFWLKSMK